MHFEDIGKLFSEILKMFRSFLKNENEHPVGKINLCFAILLVFAFIVAVIPDGVTFVVRLFFNKKISDTEPFMVPLMFIAIVIFCGFSLRLIPQTPQTQKQVPEKSMKRRQKPATSPR